MLRERARSVEPLATVADSNALWSTLSPRRQSAAEYVNMLSLLEAARQFAFRIRPGLAILTNADAAAVPAGCGTNTDMMYMIGCGDAHTRRRFALVRGLRLPARKQP